MSDHMDDLPERLGDASDMLADAAARIRELEAERDAWRVRAETFRAHNAHLEALGNDLADALEGDSFTDADGALAAWRKR